LLQVHILESDTNTSLSITTAMFTAGFPHVRPFWLAGWLGSNGTLAQIICFDVYKSMQENYCSCILHGVDQQNTCLAEQEGETLPVGVDLQHYYLSTATTIGFC